VTIEIELRDVVESDFQIFFEHQRDAEAARMAAFGTRDPAATDLAARWKKSRADASTTQKAIVAAGRVVGFVASFMREGKPQVTYWIARSHWGRGIATSALSQLLELLPARPIYASAAKDNAGSLRVLEKCGFTIRGSARAFANARGEEIDEVFLELGPPPSRGLAVPPIIETQRLILREMTESDAEHLLALSQSPNVMRYILDEPPLTSREEALAALRERVFPQYAQGLGRWACVEKSSGDYIGWCGIKHMPDDGEYDLGYRFFEEHWGKGYATEAASATCDFARRHLPGKRVVGKAMRDNVASRRVLEKVGLVFEGESENEGCTIAVYVLVA
jgi:RimJ/RimL family protein N-acetyltransferase